MRSMLCVCPKVLSFGRWIISLIPTARVQAPHPKQTLAPKRNLPRGRVFCHRDRLMTFEAVEAQIAFAAAHFRHCAPYRTQMRFTLRLGGFQFFRRQRRKRRACRLKSHLVRLTIRESLAGRTLDGKVRTFPVVDA